MEKAVYSESSSETESEEEEEEEEDDDDEQEQEQDEEEEESEEEIDTESDSEKIDKKLPNLEKETQKEEKVTSPVNSVKKVSPIKSPTAILSPKSSSKSSVKPIKTDNIIVAGLEVRRISPKESPKKIDAQKNSRRSSPQVTPGGSKKKSLSKNSMITGRGLTTQMLIEESILEPGEKNLSISYLGRRFIGDLNLDGSIKCHNANQVFSSPSAWAMNCKKQVNPDKKSGCGWASVKYKGRKLDEFKSSWFRKQRISQQLAASSDVDSIVGTRGRNNGWLPPWRRDFSECYTQKCLTSKAITDRYFDHCDCINDMLLREMNNLQESPSKKKDASGGNKNSQLTYNEALRSVPGKTGSRKNNEKTRMSVKHSMIQSGSDPTTLVECASFQSIGKIQPFSISIATNVLLLMDFHCHLTTAEVSGYIAGSWDSSRQHIRATRCYPMKTHSKMNETDIDAEEQKIRENMDSNDLLLVGWYHSHPFSQADASISDINRQVEYQTIMMDRHYEPCIAVIISPYNSYKKESQINAFWVRRPNEGSKDIGLPLTVTYTTQQNQILTQELLNEMVALVNVYSKTDEVVKFSEIWISNSSYLDKLKHSVIHKFPQNQSDGRLLDVIHKMLMAVCS